MKQDMCVVTSIDFREERNPQEKERGQNSTVVS